MRPMTEAYTINGCAKSVLRFEAVAIDGWNGIQGFAVMRLRICALYPHTELELDIMMSS
jgi:hypothetical protein